MCLDDDYFPKSNFDEKCQGFVGAVTVELENYPWITMKKMDLILFVVGRNEHYIIVCFNFRLSSIDIIDNINDNSDMSDKYGPILNIMPEAFSRFLKIIDHPKANVVCNFRPQRLEMPWRTTKPNDHCGAYTMLHLETYMGDPKNFKCCIEADDVTTLFSYNLIIKT